MVGVSLIGCGMRGMGLGDLLKKSSKFRLISVCDVMEDRVKAASERFGVPGDTDHKRMLQRPDVQAVVVATSAPWHAAVTLDIVAAGKHVYVEKPLADKVTAARQMAAAAEAAGVVAVVGYQNRFGPLSVTLAPELPSIEPVQGVLIRQRGPLNPQFFYPDHIGGIVDTATHTLDMALWTMGGSPEGVMGYVRRGTIQNDRTIDYMELIVDFDGRTRSATVISSQMGVAAASLYEFVGRRGTIWSLNDRSIHVARHDGVQGPGAKNPPGLQQREVECTGGGEGTVACMEYFADRIEGVSLPAWPRAATFREGVNALALSAGMVQSMEEGRRVPLSEVQ